ncbi:hypothetical protein SISSUDRAFT_1129702 [Sistotremastrum suecicum HHB10207 ss-3]|uniref:MYND-type domain-containing protein n=1 Tax=Sistotremastrum suecicum HHB10207 ss-3 TaxID=1314776 RepID=A0A166CCE0_9AGAM|nr:hypothetical protein SISSUDRAFT_1129702 [Sistotremastrum suecicum HHB10207 ss-3]
MPRKCEVCGVATKKTCIGCSRTAYCSTKCQKQHWFSHILECEKPGREVTTADRLVATTMTNDIAIDSATMTDYGFYKITSTADRDSIVSVYTEIIRVFGIRAPALHKWRTEGRLHAEMVRIYREAGRTESDANFQWLLQHAPLFSPDPSQTVSYIHELSMGFQRQTWTHIGGSPTDSSDDIVKAQQPWSADRKRCFDFYSLVFSSGGPMADISDVWTQFGFCVFEDQAAFPLRNLYRSLIHTCTFNEFCEAYSTSSLIALMDRKNLKASRRHVPSDLEIVLSGSPHKIQDVWYLKTFATFDEARVPTTDVLIPFGFLNCADNAAMTQLRLFYGRLFKEYKIAPPKLQDAANRDQLYEYVMNIPNLNISKVEKHYVRRVLKTQNRLRAMALDFLP